MALTIVTVAAVVAVNAIFSALCGAYLWYTDMTTENLYGVSQASHDLLDHLNGTDTQIKIIFCTTKDELEGSYYSKLVHQLALSYEKEFDFISVEYVDIIKHPGAINKYKTTAASSIKTTSVIIENGSDFRVFKLEGFYTFAESDNSVFAFNGEKKVVSAILQMTGDNPIAYFTVGHSETTTSSKLAELFTTAGYDVRTIDLTKEDIDPSAQVVIINGPVYDFIGAYKSDGTYSEVNEIEKIADFLDNHGNLMVFMNPSSMATQDFPELSEFLSEWGIAFNQSVIKDPNNAVSVDGYSLVATYETEGLGASLHKSIRELETTPKTIVRYSMPIDILWSSKSIDQSSRGVSAILTSSAEATAYSFEDENEAVGKGPFNLLTITQDVQYIDNEPYFSYVMVGGTSMFADQTYLESNAYGNADILYAAMKAMGKETVPVGIDFRLFEDNSLDITSQQANNWTIVLTAVVPALVLIGGFVVWIRRRHL